MKESLSRCRPRPLPLALALFISAQLAPALAASQESVAPVGELLSASVQAALRELQGEELAPPTKHFYRSNEWRQDLLRPHLEGASGDGLGGAFVGVGSDQNFTMAAMARAKLLFLVDYDPRIPWVHAIYGALLKRAATPDAFVALFSDGEAASTKALLLAELSGHPQPERVVSYWSRRRGPWHAYLRRVSRTERDGRPFSWLSDAALFEYVRALFREGRVVARAGDVTANGTLRAVSELCTRLRVPVRVVYFSNAEQFFLYSPEFVENMRRLPTDDATIVVRTIRHRRIPIADLGRWHYLVQDFTDFRERLDSGAYRRSFALTADLLAAGPPHLGREGLSTMTRATPRSLLSQRAPGRR